MRLLFLTEYYPAAGEPFTGGVEARAREVTRALAGDHDVTVVTSWRGEGARLAREGRLRILRVGPAYPYSGSGFVLRRLRWAIAAFRAGRRIAADLVEGTSFITYVPAALVGWSRGIPRIATYHECWLGQWVRHKGWWTGSLGELWERLALRLRWTRIISISEFTKRALVGAGVREGLVAVAPNGIHPEDFDFAVEKHDRPTIACVSRLIAGKRVDVLTRAVPSVAERVGDVEVRIVGTGPDEERLRRLAERLGMAERVAFLGRIPEHRDVLREVKRAHVFALPSEVEGFGIAALEAMASGVPVVCSDIEPLRELTAGRGALLFQPGDPEELAEMLIALLTDEDLYAEKAREAVERAREFEWSKVADEVKAIYDEAAG